MPVFTASAAYIAASVGVQSAVGLAAINFGVRAVAAYALTKLISKKDDNAGPSAPTAPGTQMPPATDNKLPVIYGTSYVVPCIVDAKMSTDQTTMWYVLAISEHTDTGTMSFDRIWWGDKELIFGDNTDQTKVTSWINSNDEENTNVANNMWVYYYSNGSNNPVNTSQSAIAIMQDPAIPAEERWTNNNLMSDCAFVIVKVEYTQNASLTGIEQVLIQATNTLSKPGSVFLDYLTNTRYGCGIPLEDVDTNALLDLDSYSNELISYIDTEGEPATQPRYRINGIVNTDNPCMTNLQAMADSCDSWIQWDEVNNKWSVIINRSYLDYTTYNDLFQINSFNIIGGVDITPTDLNNTYNSVEGQFHNTKIKDKADYVYSLLPPEDMSPNEPDNQLQVQFPYVNNSVQAQYLTTRRLIQSREDLFVTLTTDYSGIQVEAGDVVRVAQPVYGWGPTELLPENPDKLFRVSQVIEAKTEDGSLGAQISMFEYNEQVYQNINIEDYTPASNTGIPYPGWISTPGVPTVSETTVVEGQMSSLVVSATVPATGTVLYMDFYYGTDVDPSTHRLYRTVTPATGRAFVNGVTVTIHVNDIPRGVYYWSIKARGTTSQGGGESDSSASSAPSAWDSLKVLAPALIGSQLLGGLSKALMRPDVGAGFRALIAFNPQGKGPPVDITTTTNRNIPVIIPGSTIASDKIYPWYQGTVGAFPDPPWDPNSSVEGITDGGPEGWYKLMYWDTTTEKIETNEMGAVTMNFGVMTDTENTYVQIANYLIFEGDSTMVLQYPIFYGYQIPVAEPYPFNIALNDAGTGEDSIVEWGYVIRNLTPGSNLTVYAGYGVLWQLPRNLQNPSA